MANRKQSPRNWRRRVVVGAIAMVSVLGLGACGHMMMMLGGGPDRPAAGEFGLGPRTSSTGLYVATLQPAAPLAVRRLQTVRVQVIDAAQNAVDGAQITVDGGMPQHGHGLPTRPRVTKGLGNGVYEIEGVRFNMGGWWEFKLAIRTSAGIDSVTFNLDL